YILTPFLFRLRSNRRKHRCPRLASAVPYRERKEIVLDNGRFDLRERFDRNRHEYERCSHAQYGVRKVCRPGREEVSYSDHVRGFSGILFYELIHQFANATPFSTRIRNCNRPGMKIVLRISKRNSYDTKIEVRRIPDLLTQERSDNREAPQPSNLQNFGDREET